MSEAATGDQQTQTPGWLAGLPAELRDNEAFKSHKTVGDFARIHLEVAQKAKDLEGKLANSIPKLGANATQEERDRYQMALGRPAKPDEYELDGEDKNAKEWTGYWRNELFKIGVPKDQAKLISAAFNSQLQKVVDAHNATIQAANAEAQTKLKTEWGDKYEANVQLAQRLWKRDVDGDLDKDFDSLSSPVRTAVLRFIFKMAAKTGEDISPVGANGRTSQGDPFDPKSFYSKSPAPPNTR